MFGLRVAWAGTLMTCLLQFMVSYAAAEDGIPKVPFKELDVEVVTLDGNPISDAEITAWAIGGTNGHGTWIENRDGPPPVVVTDVRGQASLPYPEKAFSDQPTQIVSVHVVHSDFCPKSIHLNTAGGWGEGPKIELSPGQRIRVHVVDFSGQPITAGVHFSFAATGPTSSMFRPQADGTFLSCPLQDDWNWFRVICAPDEGPPEFSAPICWAPDDVAVVDVTAMVTPGVKVSGRLDDTVPRPVIRGRVCVAIVDWRTKPEPLHWTDTVGTNLDGEFEFESLPEGGDLQLSAICRGYLSSDDSKDRLNQLHQRFEPGNVLNFGGFKYSQIVSVAEIRQPVTLKMEPASRSVITVLDPAGNPVEGVGVGFWPNVHWIGAGEYAFAPPGSSRNYLRSGKYEREEHPDFTAWTDGEGRAYFHSLPPGKQSFALFTKAGSPRELPVTPSSPKSVDGVPGEAVEVTVHLAESIPAANE